MDIRVTTHHAGITEITITGRLNMVTAARVREAIQRAIDANGGRIAVDLSGVVFLDSSGLGALIAGLKAAREAGGDLRLLRPAEQVALVLDLTNMASVLKSFESLESAYPYE